jgi:hypothetical protein
MKESVALVVDGINRLLPCVESWSGSMERAMPIVSVSIKQLMQCVMHIDTHYV